MAGPPLVVGVEVHAGNSHSSKHDQPDLLKILDALPLAKKPRPVRGDNGWGRNGPYANGVRQVRFLCQSPHCLAILRRPASVDK